MALMVRVLGRALALASALGHGRKFVPSLVEAQEQLAHVKVIPT